MSDTNFVDEVTHVVASWLNAVNKAVYRGIGSGGVAPETPAAVRNNLGLSSTSPPTGASLIGLSSANPAVTGNDVQAFADQLTGTGGAAIVGIVPGGDISSGSVQGALTELNQEKGSLLHGNTWVGEQVNAFNVPLTSTLNPNGTFKGHDWGAWQAYVTNPLTSTNLDNLTPLISHANWETRSVFGTGAAWGIVTESWSNPASYCVLIGAEHAVISASSTMDAPSVGTDLVFKNRLDGHTQTDSPAYSDTLYNRTSRALFITSQPRPTDDGWTEAGSGWQTAIKIGDFQYGPGLDWEGGSKYPGSSQFRAYSTAIDMEDCLFDFTGGIPWFCLFKNQQTYWGMRFNGTLTGALDNYNIKVVAGGTGYVGGDFGSITGGGGVGAKYSVWNVSGGAVTEVRLLKGGSGYVPTAGATTVSEQGVGTGLTIEISIGKGLIYGAHTSITTPGSGYTVGTFISPVGGRAGYSPPMFKVVEVLAGGGVKTLLLLSSALDYSYGVRGHTIGQGWATATIYNTVAYTGAGTGLQISFNHIHDDLTIGGEKWEFWRMVNPSDPIGTGFRQGYIDASFPGAIQTIDTSQPTYTFPQDHPM